MKTKPCGLPCEVWSRVVGYHRPVKAWNKGKQEEFKERRSYSPKIVQQRLAAAPVQATPASPSSAQEPRP